MNFANKISIFRILSVPFFIASLYYSQGKGYLRLLAFIIFMVAVISDAVDGYIARKSKQKSKAGLVLDPLADKMLLESAFICLYLLNEFPFWVVLIVVTRDILILLGVVVIYLVKQEINVSSTARGKLTTTFQVSAVIAVLLRWKIAYIFWWLAVIFTVISGIDYLKKGFKILYGLDNSRHTH